MDIEGNATVVCWNCVKGRHAICDGKNEQGSGYDDYGGKPCECPVCHGNRYAKRQPVFDGARGYYYDPGPHHEPRVGE